MARDDAPRDDDFFLARWSRRKALVQRGMPPEPEPPAPREPLQTAAAVASPPAAAGGIAPATVAAPAPPAAAAPAAAPPPAPTLDDVAQLTRDADFSRFVARDVDAPVRHAALRKLFSDPRFNVMDGLDVYIDDYGRPDPLPASMLRRMVQARGLGLFQDETSTPPQGASTRLDPAGATPALPAGTEPPVALTDASAGPPQPADAEASPLPPDEDPDLQLQPHDAAGPAGDQRRAGEDPRRVG